MMIRCFLTHGTAEVVMHMPGKGVGARLPAKTRHIAYALQLAYHTFVYINNCMF